MVAGYANALTARWAALAPGAFSGAAVWPLLAYLAAAADGPARKELSEALGVPAEDAVAAADELLAVLAASPAVRSALGIWLDVEPTEWWRRTVPISGRLGETDLDAWVREHTGGLVDAMPLHPGPETLMLLASALSVRTTWLEPFLDGMGMPSSGAWAGRRFAALSRSTSDRDALSLVDGVTVLAVHGDVDVTVELGLGPDALAVLLGERHSVKPGSALTAEDAAPGVTVGLRSEEPKLRASVPRFTLAGDHDLLAHAELFGLVTAQDNTRGHFPRISAAPLAVEAARQAVTASFSARGFEAAAVTAVAMMAGAAAPPVNPLSIAFVIDGPFAFAARLRSSGLVLVAGRVEEPEPF